jgi:hypothetical protein
LAPDHSPAKLDFGAVWDGESSTRTLTFKAVAAGTIRAAIANAPFSVKAMRIMGVGASGGGASASMGQVGAAMVRNVRVSQTSAPWEVNANSGEEVQVDVLFAPKFDLFTMGAGPKASSLVIKGPGLHLGWSMPVPTAGTFYGKRIGVTFVALASNIPVLTTDKEVSIPLRLFGNGTAATGLIRSKTLPPGTSLPPKSVALGANQTLDVTMSLLNNGVQADGESRTLEIAFDYGNGSSSAATTIVGLPITLSRQTTMRTDCGVQKAHFLMGFDVKQDRSGATAHYQLAAYNSDMFAARHAWGEWVINGKSIAEVVGTTEIGMDKMAMVTNPFPITMTMEGYAEVVRGPLMVGCQGSDRAAQPTNLNPKWEQAN